MSALSRYSAGPLNVLIVDDDANVLAQLCRRLLAERHDVTTCRRAQGLADVIARRKPDLILIDVLMPDLNAADLRALLARYPATRMPGVILHSKVPVRTLRRMMDVSNALGIIQKTQNDIEFFFAFNNIIERDTENESIAPPEPAMSGTHPIPKSEQFDTYPDEEITTRTNPGRR